jgi:uncharacterized CHY-type Zn-finger protein
MCRHVLNATVFIKATCCAGWFECAECHDFSTLGSHPFETCQASSSVVTMLCKSCKMVFQKDLSVFDENDTSCRQVRREIL